MSGEAGQGIRERERAQGEANAADRHYHALQAKIRGTGDEFDRKWIAYRSTLRTRASRSEGDYLKLSALTAPTRDEDDDAAAPTAAAGISAAAAAAKPPA